MATKNNDSGTRLLGWMSTVDFLLLFLVFFVLLSAVAYGEIAASETEKKSIVRQMVELCERVLGLATETADVSKNVVQLDAHVRSETEKILSLGHEAQQMLTDVDDELQSLSTQVHKNSESLTHIAKSVDSLHEVVVAGRDQTIREIKVDLDSLRHDLAGIQKLLESVPGLIEATRREEQSLRQELLRIRSRDGSLQRVVFLIDVSTSMGFEPGGGKAQSADETRWAQVKDRIETWIKLLPVEKCAIVTFSENVSIFPAPNSYFESPKQMDWKVEFPKMIAALKSGTNTLGGIQAAVKFNDASAIILFTDGQPTVSTDEDNGRPSPAKSEAKLQEAVLRELRSIVEASNKDGGKPVPINVVGVGNYFEPEFGKFLKDVADLTGGSFIGQ